MNILGWENELKKRISNLNPDIDVEFGPVYDLVIRPMAQVLSDIDTRVGYVEKLLDISKWIELDSEEIDLLAKNYGIVRRGGTKASCVVTFYKVGKPNGKVIIPEGFVVSTVDGIKFITVERLEVSESNLDTYRNITTGRYEFPVAVEALESGLDGNVAAGSIIVMGQGLRFIDGVVNKIKAEGGFERETNEQLIDRIKMAIRGGYSSSTLDSLKYNVFMLYPNILDINIEKVNPIVEGTVDLYYKGIEIGTAVERTYWYSFDIYVANRPVIDVLSVKSGVNEYIKDVDWKFVRDTSSAWRGTDKSRDRITWISGNRPGLGTELIVEYQYNKLGKKLKDWAKLDENRFIEPLIMYRVAEGIDVEIEAEIKLYKGYGNDTIEEIKDVIYNYVNGLLLGNNLEVSDIINVVKNKVQGVDNINFSKFCKKGDNIVGDLSVEKSQYFTVLKDDIYLIKI